jgi:4-hydroxyphenylpyruvate dioxygenase
MMEQAMTELEDGLEQERGPLQFNGIDYIEFYVGNIHNAVHFYRTAFGFTPIAYAGLETGERDQVSYVLKENEIRLILTGAIHPEGAIAEHVRLHGDGVKDIAFRVNDTAGVFNEAIRRGAKTVLEPTILENDGKRIIKATIAAFGDTVHSFIQRDDPDETLLPHYQPIHNGVEAALPMLKSFDHVAVVLDWRQLDERVDFYNNVLGFHQSHHEDVMTEYSAMNSKVVEDSRGQIKFALLEPAESKRRSQIEEYLMYYSGPGVQHVAFLTEDIVGSVRELSKRGVPFLQIPPTYYSMLEERVGKIADNILDLRDLNILVDRDPWGYLMQAFTKSFNNRPTNFFEVIQRKKARGFGSGNIKALFKAVEQEQAMRGNL